MGFEEGTIETCFQIWPYAKKARRSLPGSFTVYLVQQDQDVSQE